MQDYLTVSELADKFGTTPRAIRFYETKGLIKPDRLGTQRAFSRRDQARLSLIMRAKRLGFTLRDIREYLSLYNPADGQREQSRVLLEKVEKRTTELKQQQKDIRDALAELKDIKQQCLSNINQTTRTRN